MRSRSILLPLPSPLVALLLVLACGEAPPTGAVEDREVLEVKTDMVGTEVAPELAAGEGEGLAAGEDQGPAGAEVEGREAVAGDETSDAWSCPIPQAPTLAVLHGGATLAWTVPGDLVIEVGASDDPGANGPHGWLAGSSLVAPDAGLPRAWKVFARVADAACADTRFVHVYQVQAAYAPAAGQPGAPALAMDDPRFVAWATGVVEPVAFGGDLDEEWMDPTRALGPAEGTPEAVVSLGNGGALTLTFEPPIADGEGPDFAVFENGLNDTFLELAFVEVSSDGQTWARFDGAYLGEQPVGAYAGHEPTWFGGLAGHDVAGWGTPFDLGLLAQRPEVRGGGLDLGRVAFVRVVDIVGDGSASDAFGHPIYDPTPTWGSAGFDLDAVGVLH